MTQKHADDDPVLVGYSADSNISFRGQGDELGVTWGEWRKLGDAGRDRVYLEYLTSLVNVYIQDDEEE